MKQTQRIESLEYPSRKIDLSKKRFGKLENFYNFETANRNVRLYINISRFHPEKA